MKTIAVLLVASCAIVSVKVDGQLLNAAMEMAPPAIQPVFGGLFNRRPIESLFSELTNQQLNNIVGRIMSQGKMFSDQMRNNGIGVQLVIRHMKAMFANYEKIMEEAGTCATEEMKKVPEEAMTDVLSCIPTPEVLQQKKEAAKETFNEFVAKMKEADKEISAITDEYQKLLKIAELEWTLVANYYATVSDNMYNGLTEINTCLGTQRTKIPTKVNKILGELENCTPQ